MPKISFRAMPSIAACKTLRQILHLYVCLQPPPSVIALTLLLCEPALAQQAADDSSSITELDAIDVTAKRTLVNSGALGNRSARDMPFAVRVVGREDIEKQQAISLGDVFFNDPSVVTQVPADASGWSSPIINRGLGLAWNSYRVNGMPVSSWGMEWPLEVMEQVELLKGPGGFLYGFGAPGGIVNYTTKKPSEQTTLSAKLGWRSDSVSSTQIDAGGCFGNEQMFGYRLNLFREHGSTYNSGEIDRKVAAAALDAHLSDTLTWSAELVYQSRDLSEEAPQYYFRGLSSVPRPISGDVDRSVDGSYYDTRAKLLSTGLEWHFRDGWKASLNYGVITHWSAVNKIFAYIDDPNGDYTAYAYELGGESEYRQIQAMLQGDFSTGAIKHQLVAGASREQETGWDLPTSRWQAIGRGNLYNWHDMSYSGSSLGSISRGSQTIQKAIFISDTIEFAPGWELLAGWRYNDYEQVDTYHTYPVTPTYALTYKPNDQVTLYASYIESLEAGGRVGDDYINAGEVLDATISKQYELGAKIEYARWSADAAIFRMQRAAKIDRISDAGKYLEQDGETLYQGIEASADYRINPAVSIGGGLTWLDPTYEKLSATSTAYEGNRVTHAARLQGVLHADYRPSALPALNVYAAMRYYGKVYYNMENTLELDDYTLLNLGVGYRMHLGARKLTWRLSVNNVTNKNYWAYYALGPPRNYALSVQFDL